MGVVITNDKHPLIRWGKRLSKIDTQYGKITYEAWARLERKRIGKGKVVIDGDKICMFKRAR